MKLFYIILMLISGNIYSQNNYYQPFDADLEIVEFFNLKGDSTTSFKDFIVTDTILNKTIYCNYGLITEVKKIGNVIKIRTFLLDNNSFKIQFSTSTLTLSKNCYYFEESYENDNFKHKKVKEIKKLNLENQIDEFFLNFILEKDEKSLDEFLKLLKQLYKTNSEHYTSLRFYLVTKDFLIDKEGYHFPSKNQSIDNSFKGCR